jgi:hypothetical protein
LGTAPRGFKSRGEEKGDELIEEEEVERKRSTGHSDQKG